ncbi:UDP-N-acetylmuramyl peptide synthase, partial [Pseudomonas sp. HMWF031]
ACSLSRFTRVQTPEDAALPLRGWLKPGDTVLLKASRGVALERLIPVLRTTLIG